ncbi:MAG: hypothetical protein ACK2TV_06205, partial [Anaerolineales bacterium]
KKVGEETRPTNKCDCFYPKPHRLGFLSEKTDRIMVPVTYRIGRLWLRGQIRAGWVADRIEKLT